VVKHNLLIITHSSGGASPLTWLTAKKDKGAGYSTEINSKNLK
jgi:hypothetical protein